MHIDGEYSGSIRSENTISIGKSGVLRSDDLHARKLVIAGHFHGTAECDAIELVTGGAVEGKLITSNLAVESGSTFKGESACAPHENAAESADGNVVEFAVESAER